MMEILLDAKLSKFKLYQSNDLKYFGIVFYIYHISMSKLIINYYYY